MRASIEQPSALAVNVQVEMREQVEVLGHRSGPGRSGLQVRHGGNADAANVGCLRQRKWNKEERPGLTGENQPSV